MCGRLPLALVTGMLAVEYTPVSSIPLAGFSETCSVCSALFNRKCLMAPHEWGLGGMPSILGSAVSAPDLQAVKAEVCPVWSQCYLSETEIRSHGPFL